MAFVLTDKIPSVPAVGANSPLNGIWRGSIEQPVTLSATGHLLLIFPEHPISFAGISIEPEQYVVFTPSADPITISKFGRNPAHLLILWLSPPFITDMAEFLGIPADLQALLQGVPLPRGDQISALVRQMVEVAFSAEEMMLEVVGEVLRLMRLRHDALQKLAHHRHETITDLLPRLLQARQYIEARYSEQFKTAEIATMIGLSEFHFSRLFKTAFATTLRQFVIRLRLDAARHLLEQPDMTVTTIAFQVGYGSLSSFIHAFTRRFGLSPAQYRKLAGFDKA